MSAEKNRVAKTLGIIQKTADKQGNVTMLRLAENIANDAALVRLAQEEGWDAAVREAEDCGLLIDVFADEIRGRNPYRGESCDRNGRAELQWTALEMSRKAEQAERRAEAAEGEVERLRSRLAKVRRVFDLQCPPLLPAKYDSQGAWMAHTWWDRVLGAVLREADDCQWCGRAEGHENGCRLGLGPDEHTPECACLPPYANCSHPPCGCSDCVRGGCEHDWLDRPESDSRECLICGTEVAG